MAAQTQTPASTDSPTRRRAVDRTANTIVPAAEDCPYTQFFW